MTETATATLSLQRKSRIALTVSKLSYTLMLLMMVLTTLPGQIPEQASIIVILSVKLIPLLLVLPGLMTDKLRAHIWICFIILFYFTQSVVELFLSLGAWQDIIITILSVSLFISSMLYIKWQKSLGREL